MASAPIVLKTEVSATNSSEYGLVVAFNANHPFARKSSRIKLSSPLFGFIAAPWRNTFGDRITSQRDPEPSVATKD